MFLRDAFVHNFEVHNLLCMALLDNVPAGPQPNRQSQSNGKTMGKLWPGHEAMSIRLERVGPKALPHLNVCWSNMAVYAGGSGHRHVIMF